MSYKCIFREIPIFKTMQNSWQIKFLRSTMIHIKMRIIMLLYSSDIQFSYSIFYSLYTDCLKIVPKMIGPGAR